MIDNNRRDECLDIFITSWRDETGINPHDPSSPNGNIWEAARIMSEEDGQMELTYIKAVWNGHGSIVEVEFIDGGGRAIKIIY